MIGIRADANNVVATGHIMRCITIAKQLKRIGEEVLFFIADEYPVQMLQDAGMEYICLRTDWQNMTGELPVLTQLVKEKQIGELLVDSYQAKASYLAALHAVCRVIYIDDMFEDIYPVDMVINYNGFCNAFPYLEQYGDGVKLLLGASYVPLREEFTQTAKLHLQRTEGHILLSSGGGDRYEAMPGVLEQAMETAGLRQAVFHVIAGGFCPHVDRLRELAEKHDNIILHENVHHMSQLMAQCSVAVSAAGTMLYELCAMQVPTIFFMAADNQRYDSDFFMEEGRMLYVGDIRSMREACIGRICTALGELLQSGEKRKMMAEKLSDVTDGKGALRIAEAIATL